MKKGFTLIETTVAIAVILIVSVCFFTMISASKSSYRNNLLKNYGIVEMQNVKNIFDASTFQGNTGFSTDDFAAGLEILDLALEHVAESSYEFSKFVDDDGKPSNTGLGQYWFGIEYKNDSVFLNGKVLYKDKLLYQMPTYQKVVQL